MDVALFDRCIRYISNHYEVVLMEEFVLSADLYSGKKYATIMFDDGYKDNLEYAAPILAKYNCKASFYVVTDCIEKNIPTWTHILEHSFQFTSIPEIDIHFEFLPAELHTSKLANETERLEYVKRLKPFLKKVTHEQRNQVLDTVIAAYKDIEVPKLMMNWDDLKQLKNAGHYIGSHTVTHCMLGTMSNEKEILHELSASAALIESKLGHFPLTISYPVGSYNQETVRLSKAAGYQIGLAVKQDLYDPKRDSIFEIPRIELYNEPWYKTQLRITHLLESIKSMIGYR